MVSKQTYETHKNSVGEATAIEFDDVDDIGDTIDEYQHRILTFSKRSPNIKASTHTKHLIIGNFRRNRNENDKQSFSVYFI